MLDVSFEAQCALCFLFLSDLLLEKDNITITTMMYNMNSNSSTGLLNCICYVPNTGMVPKKGSLSA